MAMIKQLFILLMCLWQVAAVNRPPHMTTLPSSQDIYFKKGESAIIHCRAEGVPKPTYRWLKNGVYFNPSGNDATIVQLPGEGTLVFNAPEAKHEGIYQCFADNDYGVSTTVRVNLREALLSRFAYESRRVSSGYAGEHLTLNCVPPTSYPPAEVFWVMKSSDGKWEPINFDKRVSMDLEGRLWFTNLKKSDENGGQAYCCMAINYFMRTNAIGPEHEIKVLGTTEQKRPAHEIWTSPSGQFFVKGKNLRLKCIFAGNPTPDVYWEKINGNMPDRASFKSFGQELQITNVTLEDAGQYQCMGLNSESKGRATKAFQVTIQSQPEWIKKPVSQEKSTGEKVVFECLAQGSPEPQYSWSINGVPYDAVSGQSGTSDPRIFKNWRVVKLRTSLTIFNLTLDYHLNIQCNASNRHGYVFADFYINVLEAPPTIITPPPPQIRVAEGQSVVITCVVTGKPDPTVTWFRDTALITGGRFKILSNGNLHIENVVMADAGDYRCQASNKFASDITSSTCKMQIRRKTRIEEYPQDLEVIAGNDAKFTCSGSTDFDEATNMMVYWEKDDKRVSATENRMTQNFQDNSLTISGTIVRDSGVYTCVITNGLDEDRAYSFLTVKDRPDPPSSVAIERCRESQADISWVKGIENNAPVVHFIVQYNTTFNPDQWKTALTADYSDNTASVDLQPWSNYTFRVIATNKIGSSIASFHTRRVCTTGAKQPFTNPQNIRSIGDKYGTLKINWISMQQTEHNGPGFMYQVIVRERGTTGSGSTYNIDKWYNNTLEHPSSMPYHPYLVTVKAKNNEGDSQISAEEKTLYSYEDVPAVTVQNVNIMDVKSQTATLTWQWRKVWVEEQGQIDDIKGEFIGFKLQYWRANERESTFREVEVSYHEVLPRNIPSGSAMMTATYELDDLSPYSNLQLQICIMNNYYVGRPSDVISFQTSEGVPGPVEYFSAQVRGSNSFSLIWRAPALEDMNGILIGYDIGFQIVHGLQVGAMHDRDEQITNPTATTAVLSGLLPATKYRVHIYAMTARGRGEGTFIEVETTLKSEFGAPKFDIRDVKETSFNVTWEGGAYYGMYVVHYVEYRQEGIAEWQQTTEEVLVNYKVVPNLSRGTYYEVRVVAFDGHYRAFSDIKVVGTVGFASARSLASNYGWFIAMLISAMLILGVFFVVYFIHKKRKDVVEPEKKRKTKAYGYKDDRGDYHDDDYHDDPRYDRYSDKEPRAGGYHEDDDLFERDSYHDGDDDYYRNDDKYRLEHQRDNEDDDYYKSDKYRSEYGDRDHDDRYDDDRYDDDRYDDDRYDDRDRDDYGRDYLDDGDRNRNGGYAGSARDRDDYSDDDDRPPAPSDRLLQNDKAPRPQPRAARRKVTDKTYDEYGKEASKFDEEGVPLKSRSDSISTDI